MTVEELLQLASLSNVKLLGGANGLNREVKWFHIIDIPQIAYWLKEGDMLFTSGYALHMNPEIMEGLIESLNEKGVSALLIAENLYLKEIPAKMIADADKYDFPIFTFPPETTLRNITHQVAELLLKNNDEFFAKYDIFQQDTLNIVLKGKAPLQQLVKLLTCKIGEDVLLLDEFGRIMAAGYVKGDRDEFLRNFRRNISSEETVNLENPVTGYYKKSYFYYHLRYNQQNVFLVVLNNIEHFNIIERIFIKNIVATIASLISNSETLKNSKLIAQIPLLESILYGQYASEELVYSKTEEQGWNMDASHFAVVFDTNNFNRRIVKGDMNERQIKDFKNEIINELIDMIKRIQGIYPVIRQELVFTTIFKLTTTKSESRIIQSCYEIIYYIKKKYEINLLIGFSSIGKELSGLPSKLIEAKEVIEIIKDMKDTQLATYDQVSLDIIVNRVIMDADLKQTFIKKMLVLAEYDIQYSSDLIHTLRLLVNNQGNVAETARSLNVHRNTIKYRMQKIEEILGISLSSANVFLNISIILKIYDLRDKSTEKVLWL